LAKEHVIRVSNRDELVNRGGEQAIQEGKLVSVNYIGIRLTKQVALTSER